MRDAIWKWARGGVPEGQILPGWLLAVRATLYPIEFLRWRMSRSHGWQYESDAYIFEGARFSSHAMRLLARGDGEVYRITRRGEVVTLERVHNVELT